MKWALFASIVLAAPEVHAIPLKRWWRKCADAIVQDDPNQYEFVARVWLERRLDAIQIASKHRALTPYEEVELKLIGKELAFRDWLKQEGVTQ